MEETVTKHPTECDGDNSWPTLTVVPGVHKRGNYICRQGCVCVRDGDEGGIWHRGVNESILYGELVCACVRV
ncbi:hypothetical protein BaRGS_00002132 [Batillaria attramentaria]|uniref:Uncharacterized protein n=1 Tax=Batillaria attramentaria TaxID=370345 RepID=A0ABD0M4X3_9CAEN